MLRHMPLFALPLVASLYIYPRRFTLELYRRGEVSWIDPITRHCIVPKEGCSPGCILSSNGDESFPRHSWPIPLEGVALFILDQGCFIKFVNAIRVIRYPTRMRYFLISFLRAQNEKVDEDDWTLYYLPVFSATIGTRLFLRYMFPSYGYVEYYMYDSLPPSYQPIPSFAYFLCKHYSQ